MDEKSKTIVEAVSMVQELITDLGPDAMEDPILRTLVLSLSIQSAILVIVGEEADGER